LPNGDVMKIADIIINRILEENTKHSSFDKIGYKSTDNISKFIKNEAEFKELTKNVEKAFDDVLKALVIDTENDHNTKETAKRVAKMFVHEIFAGRYHPAPTITQFPNVKSYDELYVTGPISVRSTCAHHMMPIRGVCYIGVYPGSNVVGLSKFNRIVEWVSSRPQIQEEMTSSIADEVEKMVAIDGEDKKNWGVAVLVQAEHFCITHRGVKEHESAMTTSILRGKFKDKPNLKSEFFNIVGMMKKETR
jgi:GTP cyclohydrolase IA